MVNPKAAIPQLINAIKRKITESQDYAKDYEGKPWDSFVESGATELDEVLKEKQRNLETRWQNEFEAQLSKDDWEKQSQEIEMANDAIDKARKELRKWIHTKRCENAPTGGVAQVQAGNQVKEATARIVESFKPATLTRDYTLEEFNAWNQCFRGYYQANKKLLEANGAEFQRNFLFSVIDVKFQTLLQTDDTVTNETVIMGPNNLLAKLKASFMADHPLYVRRYHFHEYRQAKGQSFPDWWNAKKLKAQECELEKVRKDDVMLMELICGVADEKLRNEFLKTDDPTVEKLVKIAEQWHTSDQISNQMRRNSRSNCNRISSYQNDKKNNFISQNQGRSSSQSRPARPDKNGNCYFCAGPFKNKCAEGQCRVKIENWECKNCGKRGHNKKACLSKKSTPETPKTTGPAGASTHRVKITNQRSQNGKKGASCRKIKAFDDNEDTPIANMMIVTEHNKRFKFDIMPDTGSSQGLIAENVVKKHNMVVDRKNKRNIRTANGDSMHCSGAVDFGVEYEGQRTNVRALVSHDLENEILLGWRSLQRLRIIPEDFPKPITCRKTTSKTTQEQVPNENFEALMEEFDEVFKVDGALKTMKGGPMSIKMRDVPIKPTFTSTARKCPYAFENLVKAKLDEDEELGIIEKLPIGEVTEWCSPAHFVMKPNGGVRSVVDLQGLNEYVQRPIHPFPVARDIIANIPAGTKWFAKWQWQR